MSHILGWGQRGVGRRGATLAVAVVAAGAAVVLGGVAVADDVDLTADTTEGVNLDTFTGSTVRVFPGVTVSNTGTLINGSFTGVFASAQAWTLTNQGTIDAQLGNAITFNVDGTIDNQGLIDTGFNGVRLAAGGTVTNQAGAEIDAGASAVWISGGAGTVTNGGTMTGSATTVTLAGGGIVTNELGGLIENLSQANAVSVIGGTSREIVNHGTIRDVSGGFATGAVIRAGTLTNHAGGTIEGTYNAIWAISGGPTAIVNAGTLTAVAAGAIEMQAGGSVDNSSVIQGSLGIEVTGGSTAVTNSGTITGTGGTAIRFASGANSLTLEPGSAITGNVLGDGNDLFQLGGAGVASFDSHDIGPAAQYRGFGTFEKVGGSMWTLTGSGGQSWSVLGGTLFADGILGGAFDVFDGAVLGGVGSVGALTAHTGGIIAPGNSIGTLEAATATFDAGSLFEVEIDPLTADKLIVTGTATISLDAMVRVLPMTGAYSDGFEYLILDAGTRVGEFGGLIEDSAFLDFTLDHVKDANQVWLTVLNVAAFPDVAETPNQIATAEALEALGPGNPIFDAILVLDEDQARTAFDLASGEVHATLVGALVDDSRFIREAVVDRLRQRFDGAFRPAALGYAAEEDDAAFPPSGPMVAAWANGFATAGSFAGDGNAAAFDRRLGGAVGGVDWTVAEGWRFGLAGGLQSAGIDVPDRASSAGIDTAHVAAYGGLAGDGFAVRFGGAYAWHQVATVRDVAFPGFSDRLTASYGARTAQVFSEAGIPMETGGVTVEPFAGLAHVHVATDGFTESGGPAVLSVPSSSASVTYSTLGARFAAAFGEGRTRLHAMGAWQHTFDRLTPMAMPAFAGGDPFAIAGVPLARDALRLELGVDHTLSPGATASLLYSGSIASGVQDHGVKGKVAVRF